ncbi:MAG: DNA internalization-related competence protein ComEC/Rec2 [Actinomycetota bacterium]
MVALANSRWFERRPCAWAALAAAGAVWLTYVNSTPAIVWIVCSVLGGGAALLGLRRAGALLAMASVYGILTALAIGGMAAGPREGAPITIRGRVEHARPAAEGRTRLVVKASAQRAETGWAESGSRYGAMVDGAATAGDLVEVSGRVETPLPATNPGGFDSRVAWLRHGVGRLIHVRAGGYTRLGAAPRSAWGALAARLRAHVLAMNRRTLSPEAAVIANNFLVGDDAGADAEITEDVKSVFRESGTLHLLVVSGTQVSLVALTFVWVGWRFQRLRYVFWALGLVALALFHAITEGDASVSRAAVMGAVLVGALLFSRRPDGENCLGLAALALLAINPFALLDVGAQLSFAAVWSLVRVAPAVTRLLGPPKLDGAPREGDLMRGYWSAGAHVAGACIAAHLATAPILALHFQTSSWSGLAANLCISILAGSFITLAILHTVLASLGIPLLTWLTETNAAALHGWAGYFATPPLGTYGVFPPPLWLLPASFAVLLLAGLPKSRSWITAAALASVTAVLLLSERLPATPPSAPTLRAIDIGQGDAVLLQGTDGSNVLCDAGTPAAGRSLVRALRGLRVGQLDAVLLSHAHADHVGGLKELLAEAPPRLLIHGEELEQAENWPEIELMAAQAGVRRLVVAAGDRVRLRHSALTVLGPLPDAEATDNEESLVARWDSDGARVLLTGDIGQQSERGLLRWGEEVRADVLKVAHHGSNGSSAPELLKAVGPRYAVISCGRNNRFGHPSLEALARIETASVPIARTDLGGMVTVRLRPGGPEVEKFLRR